MPIYFHNEDISFKINNKKEISLWINCIGNKHKKKVADINLIFCSDNYLLSINNKYLNHNYYTDIISFDYSFNDSISGDIYISIDRVKDNAIKNNLPFLDEIHRVIIHGVLHLCGFNDDSAKEKEEMRKLENISLSLRNL